MPFLVEIKERLQSTQDTRKITQSLELVAANKMKSFVRKALSSRGFSLAVKKQLDLLFNSVEVVSENIYFNKRDQGATLFVLLTSDKGLCGNLNQRLIKGLFESEKWLNTPSETRLLITIGKKALEASKKRGFAPVASFVSFGEDLKPINALPIIDGIMKYWHDNTAKEIYLIAPTYVNPFTNHVNMSKYLPFDISARSGDRVAYAPEPIMEPSASRVMEMMGLQIVQAMFLEGFYELKACEYSSRMVAMKSASDSALEMIKSLTLEYNKARQGQITQQLSELACAMEAMA